MTKLSSLLFSLAVVLSTACGPKASSSTAGGGEAGGGAAAASDQLAFAWRPQAVGSVEETVDTLRSAFTLTGPEGQPMEMTSTRDLVYHFEVIEAGDVVTRAQVHYDKAIEARTMGGQGGETPLPIHGKAYVLWLDGGRLAATTADGQPASPDELEVLADKHGDALGKVPPMAQVIAKRTWIVGEQVAIDAADLAILNEAEDWQAESAAVRLVSSDGAQATFEVEMAGAPRDAGGEVRIEMRMTAVVEVATLQTRSLRMEGTVGGSAQGMAMSGTLSGAKTTTVK